MKKIVTHLNPDLDAMVSVWLIRRFLPDWSKAAVYFVPAGSTLNDEPVDDQPEVLHVDTGLGQLDHHQRVGEITSAARLTWQYILEARSDQSISDLEIEVVNRLVEVVNQIDNARDLSWPESVEDRFELYLHSLIYGLKRNIPDDHSLTTEVMVLLDALARSLKDKIRAEEALKEKGLVFQTRWGKAVAVKTGNEKILWEAEIRGYVLVVKYDPRFKKRVKIYSHYDSAVNLLPVYRQLRKVDSEADWFLHASRKLLLISSHPDAKPTSLSLEEIVDLLAKKN